MKHTGQCPKCGSQRIVNDAMVIDRGHMRQVELKLAALRKPEALIFKDPGQTTVSAWVCADCGYVELYADQPANIAPKP